MNWKLKKIIFTVFIIYAILLLISIQIANCLLALFLIGLVPWFAIRMMFINKIYNDSTKLVEKNFVINKNKIQNANCIVEYNPDKKILISDNLTNKQRREKRIILLDSEKGVNVNKTWYDICRIFDEYTYFDTLAAFVNDNGKIKVQLVPTAPARKESDTQEQNTQIQNTNDIPQKTEITELNITVNSPEKKVESEINSEYVDIANITPDRFGQNQPQTNNQDNNMVEMDNLLVTRAKMIDVNHADAEQLSNLPGVNLIIAKKIIDYRNKNGLFKNPEQFFEIAGIKDHFVEKVSKQIILGKPTPKDDNPDKGRIVDF